MRERINGNDIEGSNLFIGYSPKPFGVQATSSGVILCRMKKAQSEKVRRRDSTDPCRYFLAHKTGRSIGGRKMKVELEYEDGKIVELEAQNSFHAHNIMLYSFFLVDEEGKLPINANCKEIGANFHRNKNNELEIRPRDTVWRKWFFKQSKKEGKKSKFIKCYTNDINRNLRYHLLCFRLNAYCWFSKNILRKKWCLEHGYYCKDIKCPYPKYDVPQKLESE